MRFALNFNLIQDVEWWMREKIQEQNYTTWFPPSVSIVGRDGLFEQDNPFHQNEKDVIQYGDMLHVDFGVTALGMNTDTQHLAYVLHPGESEKDIPNGLLSGLRQGNRLQDIVIENMDVGLSGNTILKNIQEQMKTENIDGRIYSHPIGDWGHSAGTLIGKCKLYHCCFLTDFARHVQSARRCSHPWGSASFKQDILQCGVVC